MLIPSGHETDEIPDESELETFILVGPSWCSNSDNRYGLRGCANLTVKYTCALLRSASYLSFATLLIYKPAVRSFMRKHPLARALFALLSWTTILTVSSKFFISCSLHHGSDCLQSSCSLHHGCDCLKQNAFCQRPSVRGLLYVESSTV